MHYDNNENSTFKSNKVNLKRLKLFVRFNSFKVTYILVIFKLLKSTLVDVIRFRQQLQLIVL